MNHEEAIKEWDLTIEPQRSLFQINLKDVWRYRDLLGLLVKRDITAGYKQTILGPIWMFLQPLFTTITFTFVFGNLAGLSTDGLPQPLFYMAGTIAWTYFSDCLTGTAGVFRANAGIFGKVYFPRLIMPLTLVISNLMKFGIQLFQFLILYIYYIVAKNYQPELSAYILLLPFLILLMAMLGLGLGMTISAMTTKYRDLSFLLGFGMTLFMYATPVIYPLSATPEKYKAILSYNPIAPILEGFRYIVLGAGTFNWNMLGYTTIVAFITLAVGTLIFNKVEKDFVDTV
ncbi:MAG: ABC transporter permease [Bacteroidota bacterium]|jgi:lipopolysaccharide transport system permease protein